METAAERTTYSDPVPGHRRHVRMPRPAPRVEKSWKERLWPSRRPRMVFDPDRCTGCGLCETVCSSRDGSAPDLTRIQIQREESVGANFAIFCQHCLDPLCLPTCPQHAIDRGKDGIVRVDERLCVHCGLCILACPEAAPRREPGGRVLKCDLCGGNPQCVEACPQKALTFSPGKTLGWIRFLRWPVQAVAFLLLVVVLMGTVCSLSVGQWSFGCPLGLLQNMAASKIIIMTTVFAALFIVVLTLTAGRLVCGWLCPFGFLLDLAGKLFPRRIRLPEVLRTRLAKYGVAGAALGVSGAVGYQAFCTVCPIGTVCRSYGLQSMVGGAELAVLPVVAALEVSEKRTWCRYLCPVGALLALFARIGLIKIVIGASRCKKFSCMRCTETCPMGIVPESDLREGVSPRLNMGECIMCLRCMDTCPHGAVKIRFWWQKAAPGETRAALGSCGRSDGGGPCPS